MAQMKDGTVSKADQDKAAINVAHPEELLKQLQQLKAHGKVRPGSVTEQIMSRLQDQIRNAR
jgi:cytochrome c553